MALTKEQVIEQYINLVDAHLFNVTDVHLSHGGAMVMLGLRETTADIDITVTPDVWERLLEQGYVPVESEYTPHGIIAYNEHIDVHVGYEAEGKDYTFLWRDNVMFRSAAQTLRDKLELNRSKDKSDIEKLIEYLSKYGDN